MPLLTYLNIAGLFLFIIIQSFICFWLYRRQTTYFKVVQTQANELSTMVAAQFHQQQLAIQQICQGSQSSLHEQLSQGQLTIQQLINQHIQQQMVDIREQITHSFKQHLEAISTHLGSLNLELRHQLQALTRQVDQQLSAGFEKTSSTFTDVVRRLTIIDEAQKKITELSSHVVSLQDILMDKRTRGAFGEIQLETLIANMIPPNHYQMQYTLSNQKRADCMLFLPPPSGSIVIDAKFPLENYQKMMHCKNPLEKTAYQQRFRQDLIKHMKDIAEKYILPPETADGAILFMPAEAIFAEIHANYPELIAYSQRLKVWLVSPTTLMAVLTTARAVLKDDATRKQVHIIQKHLHALAEDFQRFEKRMDKLSRHIDLAHQDVNDVNVSAKRITQRFQRIEAVELDKKENEVDALLATRS